MDLYDDLDTKQRAGAGQIDGWSSGIKMLQTQLAIKKANLPPPRREPTKKPILLTPVASLRPKKAIEEDVRLKKDIFSIKQITVAQPLPPTTEKPLDVIDWDESEEYNPLWPNEYDKLIKEKRDKEKERHDDYHEHSHRDRNRKRRTGNNSRFVNTDSSPPNKYSGFGGRSNDEDSYSKSPPISNQSRSGGAAIAPPPSLQETSITSIVQNENSSNVTIPYGASSVAAKIMAKYGFKDGQGLGKQEQGMSMALQVEKTSKRGGRIIHEKELLMPPPPETPTVPIASITQVDSTPKTEPTITEIMKSPSKVVLLRNMVGPGDVDSELEPEVKDECNIKYGDVVSVVIKEIEGVVPEEAVKIFVEFKRIESAIKAVVDLNGRFFGGRQVRAGFYDYDKFKIAKIYD